MSDIVERLQDMFVRFGGENNDDAATRRVKTAKEAADEIEKLRAERDALRAVLRQIGNGDTCVALLSHPPICSRAMAARVVLGEKK